MLYEVHFITPNGKEMTLKFVIPKHVNVLKHIKLLSQACWMISSDSSMLKNLCSLMGFMMIFILIIRDVLNNEELLYTYTIL